VVAKLVDAAA